jgi:uncharacterized protein YodC (DUF2158 family)
MAEHLFEAGYQVQMKSGGPIMTVVDYNIYGAGEVRKKYLCRWFDAKNELKESTFTEPELRRVD